MAKTSNQAGSALKDGDREKARGVADAGTPPPGGPTTFEWIRENIEALIVAVILAIIIRHFAVEAFEIPTGSMAPTLYGIHAWLNCPNCPTPFNLSLRTDPVSGKVVVPYHRQLVYRGDCPNPNCTLDLHGHRPDGTLLAAAGDRIICGACGTNFAGASTGYSLEEVRVFQARCPICHHVYTAIIDRRNVTGGHKILVTKFAYALGEPRRWDVVVFGFDQWKNYIKRLVGLPGDTLQVWDGDLYVNGRIERKSDHPYAQDVLWTQIADSNMREGGLNRVPAWSEIAPQGTGRGLVESKNAQWNPPTLRWSFNALEDIAVIQYRRGFANYYNYNLIGEPGGPRGYPLHDERVGDRSLVRETQVGDRKVAFTVKVAGTKPRTAGPGPGGSWVGAEIRDGDFIFQLRIPVGPAAADRPAILERVGTDGAPVPNAMQVSSEAAVLPGTSARVELENADDRMTARLNGEVILKIDYQSLPGGADLVRNPPPEPGTRTDDHHLRLMVCGAQAEIESIQVHRDMYYIPRNKYGYWTGITLGDGQYLAMGDNAPSSSDARYWGSFPETNLMGKALVVFWPAWPTNFQWKFIR